ncbi:hypothetical protein KOR42_09100 [Thalassoglobus neptunius]|uniref:Uncharacterized protein n=1 Tax=Thalassoglobus neptunius TaxID=1938619 RepID=A0A5C5X4P2_9PLAN|nr:hypothetical protein [Thalassoglobus neptunius]TWT57549.1 hypothetical protein KOR42_09100 [Thalassoglobus neptunius]
MDKLQPLIRNRFWILGALTLPLAMYGFFSANGALKAATEQRVSTLKGLTIPTGTNDPNEDYKEKLATINAEYEQNVESSIVEIWNKQKERMTWPSVVANDVPPIFMDPEGFDLDVTDTYKRHYSQLMLKLQERVEPVMPIDRNAAGGAAIGVPFSGRGAMPQEADVPWQQKVILAAQLPIAQFDRLAATSEQVWNAQIDIWLLELLFDAVRKMNEDKDSVTEAVLRRIDVLILFGGSGEPRPTGAPAAAGGYGGYDSGYGGGYDSGYPGPGGGGGGGYGSDRGGSGASMSVNVAFDPAQEFGSSADASASASTASMGYSAGGYDDEYGSGYGGGYGGMASGGKQLRYIADSEEKRVLERGFYMSVIIMQSKIPDFIVELANSEWPIRVTRFHVGKNPYFSEAGAGAQMYGSPMGMMGGYGGEGDYDGDESYGGGYAGSYGGSYGGGFGSLGAGGQGAGIPGVGNLSSNLPAYATAAMNHPDLVQLDLCGVITMFKQPQEIIDALTVADGEAVVDDTTISTDGTEMEVMESETLAPEATEDDSLEIPATESADPVEIPATESAVEEETVEAEAVPADGTTETSEETSGGDIPAPEEP